MKKERTKPARNKLQQFQLSLIKLKLATEKAIKELKEEYNGQNRKRQ